MKLRQIEVLLLLMMTLVAENSAMPIFPRDRMILRSDLKESNVGKPIIRNGKMIGTCLRIAPNLPPCDFDSEATLRSRSGEILTSDPVRSGYSSDSIPEFFVDGNNEKILSDRSILQEYGSPILKGEKNLQGYDFYENDLAITVVYYLEGCLPARLPFDVPSCPTKDLQTIQMNKLVPFQLPDIQDPMIFPEIDIEKIEFSHRQSRASSPSSQSHEESEEEKKSPIPKEKRSLTVPRDVESSAKGVYDIHNTIPKSMTNPRTGKANTKYVSKLGTPGSISMLPGYSRSSRKNKGIKDGIESILEWINSEGSREPAGTSGKNKNRLQ